jgi:hypothetical protein
LLTSVSPAEKVTEKKPHALVAFLAVLLTMAPAVAIALVGFRWRLFKDSTADLILLVGFVAAFIAAFVAPSAYSAWRSQPSHSTLT